MTDSRRTLERARIFLRLSDDLILDDREGSAALLDAAVVFGRSVTFHMQKEFKRKEGFAVWYKAQEIALRGDSLCKFFHDTRTYIVHEGPARMQKKISVSLGVAGESSIVLSLTVVRGSPWYRRRPKILWEDFRRAARYRLRPLQSRLRTSLSRGIELLARLFSGRSDVTTRPEQRSQAQRSDTWHFAGTEWEEESAADLVRRYLDTLEPIVREAERRFKANGQA